MAGYCTLVPYFHSPAACKNTSTQLSNILPSHPLCMYYLSFMIDGSTLLGTINNKDLPLQTCVEILLLKPRSWSLSQQALSSHMLLPHGCEPNRVISRYLATVWICHSLKLRILF